MTATAAVRLASFSSPSCARASSKTSSGTPPWSRVTASVQASAARSISV